MIKYKKKKWSLRMGKKMDNHVGERRESEQQKKKENSMGSMISRVCESNRKNEKS